MFAKAIVALAVAAVVSAQSTISTPTSLIQCQPIALAWTAGAGAPYFVSAIPGGDASGAALEQIGGGPLNSTTFTWTVNIAAGTSVTMKVIDKSGTPNYSDKVTVQAGSSTCTLVNASGGSASSGAASSAASPAASSAAASAAASSTASAAGMATSVRASATSAAGAATSAAGAATSAAAAAATSKAASSASTVVVGSGAFAAVAALVVAAL
ncbi:BZ3500_MvSof-1268-A1-R1_Chr3-3g06479 [Microbotryum saponariae]|uniref:BZ3500_MvSof-1268-A1-R1_Chr3-3g06479 protein n=1 Tax=Microbotryum saponariae TaxID=289078 RepID=A0A2X0KVC0_9BASI|nr:BZ3500_MvSof-1268-A1-R1_Chr3-3g06479 [Microbotryum saponariae]SDA04446.1 BZ3501_MvSof-1269-A2-R1_Chr3-2g06166 [Microbotryum saponariae]